MRPSLLGDAFKVVRINKFIWWQFHKNRTDTDFMWRNIYMTFTWLSFFKFPVVSTSKPGKWMENNKERVLFLTPSPFFFFEASVLFQPLTNTVYNGNSQTSLVSLITHSLTHLSLHSFDIYAMNISMCNALFKWIKPTEVPALVKSVGKKPIEN